MSSFFSPPAVPGHPESDLQHPDDVIHTLTYVVQGICMVVTTICVLLRLLGQRYITNRFQIQDDGSYLIICMWCLCLLLTIYTSNLLCFLGMYTYMFDIYELHVLNSYIFFFFFLIRFSFWVIVSLVLSVGISILFI